LLRYRAVVAAGGKNPEIEAAIDTLLDIIGANVRAFMEERIEASNKPFALAKKANLGKGTVQRVCAGSKGHGGQQKSAPGVDTLMYIAAALDVPFGALFVPRDRKSRLLAGLDSPPSKPSTF
jgi:transcriptional regulator with XRE-family HTH domain